MRLRRSLIIVVVSYGYFLIAFAFWRRGSELPAATKIIALAGVIVAAIGAYLAQRDLGLWLMVISITCVTFYFAIDPWVSIAWIQLSVLVAIISLLVIFLYVGQRKVLTLALLVGLALFNLVSYYFGATSLLQSGSFLGRGSISSMMILSTNFYGLYGWNRMLLRSKSNDEKMISLQEEIKMLEKSQESQRLWRELVIRVHETTLNTIRSLLTLKDLPIENFREEIKSALSQGRPLIKRAQERRTGSVIGSIRAGIDSAALQERVRIISQGVNLHLDGQVADVVERAIREALRNATEHAKAKNIEILWRTVVSPDSRAGERERGRVHITITDDGVAPMGKSARGIGTNLVMAKSIQELGGAFSLDGQENAKGSGTVVRIEVPTFVEAPRQGLGDFPTFSAVELGRYMALLTLFGAAMTGLFFFPILSIWWANQLPTQFFGFFSLSYLLYGTFIRTKRLGWIESVAVAIGLLATIFFLDLNPLTCTQSQPFQWVINSVVYGLFIILLWGKWQVTAISYPIFLYLVAPFHDLIPQDCNFIFNFPILNTLFSFLFVALVFTTVYKTFERVERYRESRVIKNVELVSEIERNDAAFEKILELDALAQQSIQNLLVATGPIAIDAQLELRRIDAQLRAEIQVDPVASTGLTCLASEFVYKAVAHKRWLEVRSIYGDEDSRPLPQILRERFCSIASEIPNGSAIQVVMGEGYAELSLHCRTSVPESVHLLKKNC